MTEALKRFTNRLKHNQELQSKVIIGHILIAKVFLDIYFEKYYINFIKDEKFDEEAFLKSVAYIDLMLSGDNYTQRYASFDDMIENIALSLRDDEAIPLSLRQSIIGDLSNIIGKQDENGVLMVAPYSLDFETNKEKNSLVKQAIQDFGDREKAKLVQLFHQIEINHTKDSFLAKIKEILK